MPGFLGDSEKAFNQLYVQDIVNYIPSARHTSDFILDITATSRDVLEIENMLQALRKKIRPFIMRREKHDVLKVMTIYLYT